MFRRVEHEKSFITSGPDKSSFVNDMSLVMRESDQTAWMHELNNR